MHSMHGLPTILLSLLFFLNKPLASLANQEDDFLKVCPPSNCGSGSGSLQIRFPLSLRSAPPSCGFTGLDLTCSGGDTLLSLLPLPHFKVADISYETSELTLDLRSWLGPGSGPCPPLDLSSLLANITTSAVTARSVSWVRCSTKFVPCSGPTCGDIAGPAPSCFVDEGYFLYLVGDSVTMDALPRDCEMFRTGGYILCSTATLQQALDVFSERREVALFWDEYAVCGTDDYGECNKYAICRECERGGRQCGFNFARNQSFCIGQQHHGENTLI